MQHPKGRHWIFAGYIVQDMFRACFILLASVSSLGVALRAASPKSVDDAFEEAEVRLAKECGSECVTVLRSIVNASTVGNGGKAELVMKAMSDQGLGHMDRAQDLLRLLSTGTAVSTGSSGSRLSSKGTACGTPADCELEELALNQCTYGFAA